MKKKETTNISFELLGDVHRFTVFDYDNRTVVKDFDGFTIYKEIRGTNGLKSRNVKRWKYTPKRTRCYIEEIFYNENGDERKKIETYIRFYKESYPSYEKEIRNGEYYSETWTKYYKDTRELCGSWCKGDPDLKIKYTKYIDKYGVHKEEWYNKNGAIIKSINNDIRYPINFKVNVDEG